MPRFLNYIARLSTLLSSKRKEDLNEPSPPTRGNRFALAIARLGVSPLYSDTKNTQAPYGAYDGRPIIGECSPVNGGVYVGATPHEAVVVDEKYGTLEKQYDDLVLSLARFYGPSASQEQVIVSHVLQTVKRTMQVSERAANELTERRGIINDQKAALDIYIGAHIGAPRHLVLLAGYFLEKLRSRGLIKGNFSIGADCDLQNGARDEKLFYTSPEGKIFSFDPRRWDASTSHQNIELQSENDIESTPHAA